MNRFTDDYISKTHIYRVHGHKLNARTMTLERTAYDIKIQTHGIHQLSSSTDEVTQLFLKFTYLHHACVNWQH